MGAGGGEQRQVGAGGARAMKGGVGGRGTVQLVKYIIKAASSHEI